MNGETDNNTQNADVSQAHEETMNTLHFQQVTKYYKNLQIIKQTPIEIERLDLQIKNFRRQIAAKDKAIEKHIEERKEFGKIIEMAGQSQQVVNAQQMLLFLTEKRDALKTSYDETIVSYRAKYMEAKKHRETDPEYVELKKLEKTVLRLNIQKREADNKIAELKATQKRFNEIQQKLFNSQFIGFAEVLTEYKNKVKQSEEFAKAEQKRKELEKKLDELQQLIRKREFEQFEKLNLETTEEQKKASEYLENDFLANLPQVSQRTEVVDIRNTSTTSIKHGSLKKKRSISFAPLPPKSSKKVRIIDMQLIKSKITNKNDHKNNSFQKASQTSENAGKVAVEEVQVVQEVAIQELITPEHNEEKEPQKENDDHIFVKPATVSKKPILKTQKQNFESATEDDDTHLDILSPNISFEESELGGSPVAAPNQFPHSGLFHQEKSDNIFSMF